MPTTLVITGHAVIFSEGPKKVTAFTGHLVINGKAVNMHFNEPSGSEYLVVFNRHRGR